MTGVATLLELRHEVDAAIEAAERRMEAAQQAAESRFSTPGRLAKALNPETVQTPALELIDAALVQAEQTPGARLIISMPPRRARARG